MQITVKQPSPEELAQLHISDWSSWRCDVSTFDWVYTAQEIAYVFEGRVFVRTASQNVEIKAGDLAVFPKGLSCTWTVEEPIRKVYRFV